MLRSLALVLVDSALLALAALVVVAAAGGASTEVERADAKERAHGARQGDPVRSPMRFVFSPYKHVAIARDPQTQVFATAASGKRSPLVVGGRSTLPAGVTALTLAFATGECGEENWDGADPQQVADANLRSLEQAGIDYIISTGGAAGAFTCGTDAGMEKFIARYASSRLVGLDFDIEAGQTVEVIDSLVRRAATAQKRHPQLRLSFTLATLAASDGSRASLNRQGEIVMRAIRDTGLTDYYVNLMVMDYGDATRANCVVVDGVCDMGRSAIQAARNFHETFGVPLGRIELTPMIGVNDVHANVFTVDDARVTARYVREQGLAGLHFWSLDRDTPCVGDTRKPSPSCSNLDRLAPLEFTRVLLEALR
jgi:chitinase